MIENFIAFLAATGHPDLTITKTDGGTALVENSNTKLAVTRIKLPVLFVKGFNPMDAAHLSQVRHRLDTAMGELSDYKGQRKTIVLAEAWDAKMKLEEIKASIDAVSSPGVPLEVDAIWYADPSSRSHFCDVTPNRPKFMAKITHDPQS